jgi:hypothetical protein
MEAFWGPDAQTFRPERWLDEKDIAEGAMREIKSYKHILTFSDGPRTCIGKGFALAEMKVCPRLAFPLPSVFLLFFPLLFPSLNTLTLTSFYFHGQGVLSVLIRKFIFQLPEGPDTEIEIIYGFLPRPRTKGDKGATVTMKVTRVE